MAFPAGYTKYQEITIDNTKVAADLTDYTLLVDLADLVKAGADVFDTCRTDGGDLRATKSDGTTELPIEVVAIDTTAKTGEVHIKITGTTSSSTDTVIRLYYNGTDVAVATTATYGAENVWDSNYKLVAHDVDDDSTSGANNGTLEGSTAVITGKVGDGRQFEATGNRVNYGSSFGESYSAATYSTWIRVNNTSNEYHFLGKNDNIGILVETSGQIRAAIHTTDWQSPVWSGGSYTVTAGTWHKIDLVYTGSNLSIYFDGVSTGAGVSATGTLGNNGNDWFAGSYFVTSQWINGDMDELRVSDIARSSDWFSTTYNNQNSPSTFYSSSAEVGGTSSVSFDASPLTATFSIPAYTPQTGTTESVSPLTATFSIVAATTSAGTTQTASPLTATFSIPPNTADLPDYEFSASPLTATFSQPAFTISTSSAYAAAVLSAVFSIPTSVTTGDANTSAGVLSATFTIPVYTLDVVFNIQGAKITPQLTLKRERVKLKKY